MRAGQDGTVIFVDTTNNDLYLYDRLLFQARENPYTFNRIMLSDGATVHAESGVRITAHAVHLDEGSSFDTRGIDSFTTDSLLIEDSSIFTSAEGQSLAVSALTLRNRGAAQFGRGETLGVFDTITLENDSTITTAPMHILHLEARDIILDETSAISVTGMGYAPQSGPGFNDSGAGASHGGLGESGTPSPVYGSAAEPVDFGSGGSPDAHGGGSLRIIVSGTLENNGSISADAEPWKNGASGGSIYVTTNVLSGSGTFTALGGNTRGYITGVGAGGGGRVAVYYDTSDFVGTTSAKGGDRYVGGSSMSWYFAQDGTVVFEKTAPKGPSSILFIPGIQASRLYTEVDGQEEKIWEPFGDDDFNHLAMNELGESERDVYTKDVVDELYGFSSMSIYKKFITFLNAVDGDTGPMVRTFPYDWRHDVFDIVENGTKDDSGLIKKPIETIEYLATLSPTKKATLIAHSNGGLLAKAIMLKLEEQGKSHLVDKIIFIGTPHIGTPKALATVLHGYDQEHASGIISDDAVARRVMKNMPGVYGLLPSEAYINSLSEPLISFDDSEITSVYRNKYGFTITPTEYRDFLNGAEGRADAENRINEPSKANTTMLENALQRHRDLDIWTAPESITVFNLVGTGLPTPKSIEYKAFDGVRCYIGYQCMLEKEIEPVLNFSGYGDKTVMSKSAGFLNANNFYIDLSKIEKFEHSNITEADTTQTLVDHLLHGSSTSGINFVSQAEPVSNVELEVVSIHSPARMYLRDSFGNVTGKTSIDGKWLMEIEGSTYLEAGNVKYVIVPKSTSYEVIIEGEGGGVFTTVISELHGDVEHEVHRFTATTSSTTIATFEKSSGEFSPVSIDEDGNGVTDVELTVDGVIIEKPATYSNLRSVISSIALPKIHKEILLQFVKSAESLHSMKKNKIHAQAEKVILSTLDKTILLYERKKLISAMETEKIRKIINSLITQIVWEKKN